MRVGDKIVCVNNSSIGNRKTAKGLTIGKTYTVKNVEDLSPEVKNPEIINDFGEDVYYYYKRFITLEDYRNLNINKILNHED